MANSFQSPVRLGNNGSKGRGIGNTGTTIHIHGDGVDSLGEFRLVGGGGRRCLGLAVAVVGMGGIHAFHSFGLSEGLIDDDEGPAGPDFGLIGVLGLGPSLDLEGDCLVFIVGGNGRLESRRGVVADVLGWADDLAVIDLLFLRLSRHCLQCQR
jgi:hypothetical protein